MINPLWEIRDSSVHLIGSILESSPTCTIPTHHYHKLWTLLISRVLDSNSYTKANAISTINNLVTKPHHDQAILLCDLIGNLRLPSPALGSGWCPSPPSHVYTYLLATTLNLALDME